MHIPQLVKHCNSLLKNNDFDYAICGGFALELFIDNQIRPHGDIDICTFWKDRDKIATYMLDIGWTVYEACGNGKINKIDSVDNYTYINKNLFCVRNTCDFFKATHLHDNVYECEIEHVEQKKLNFVEFLFNSKSEKGFHYNKNHEIYRSINKSILFQGEIPYLSPEIVLLYKSRLTDREGYQFDFDTIIPYLSKEQFDWLHTSLLSMNPDGHKWIDSLSHFTSQ